MPSWRPLHLWCYSVVFYSNVGSNKNCWIGLYKSEPEASNSVTYWLDRNMSTYRNWDAGEPNSENLCVVIENGKFRDAHCSTTYHYVCEGIYFFFNFETLFFVHFLLRSHWGRLSSPSLLVFTVHAETHECFRPVLLAGLRRGNSAGWQGKICVIPYGKWHPVAVRYCTSAILALPQWRI